MFFFVAFFLILSLDRDPSKTYPQVLRMNDERHIKYLMARLIKRPVWIINGNIGITNHHKPLQYYSYLVFQSTYRPAFPVFLLYLHDSLYSNIVIYIPERIKNSNRLFKKSIMFWSWMFDPVVLKWGTALDLVRPCGVKVGNCTGPCLSMYWLNTNKHRYTTYIQLWCASHCFPIFYLDGRSSYHMHKILSTGFLDRKTMRGTPYLHKGRSFKKITMLINVDSFVKYFSLNFECQYTKCHEISCFYIEFRFKA